MWIKPPGESDGTSIPVPDQGGSFDAMCGPTFLDEPTGALPGAPPYRQWFSAHFQRLLANAYPPL